MKTKIILLLFIIIIILSPSSICAKNYEKEFWSVNGKFVIGQYENTKIIVTKNLFKNKNDKKNNYNLDMFVLNEKGLKDIKINLNSFIKPIKNNKNLFFTLHDLDGDEKDELLINRFEGDGYTGEIAVFKIFLKDEESYIKKVWSLGNIDAGWIITPINKNNLLIQLYNETTNTIFVLGNSSNGKIKKKWENICEYGEYAQPQFIDIENQGIFVRLTESKWNKIKIVKNKIVLEEPNEEAKNNIAKLTSLEHFQNQIIGLHDLDYDKELEVLSLGRDFPYYYHYKILSLKTKKVKFDLEKILPYKISTYIPEKKKIILENGYTLYWCEHKFVYQPWEKVKQLEEKEEIWNVVEYDLDDDGDNEIILLEGKRHSNSLNPKDSIFKIRFRVLN